MKFLSIAFFINIFFNSLFANSNYYYNNGKKVNLTPVASSYSLKSTTASNEMVRYYKTSDDVKIGVSDEIIIKLYTKEAIDNILLKYDVKLIKSYSDNIYLLKVENSAHTLEISNRLHLEKSIKFAHPNFIKEAIGR